MSTHKYIDRICCAAIALVLAVTFLFMNGKALGLPAASKTIGYENRLFDISKVHTIDIVMDDWDGFLASCTQKEYEACSLVIDGEAFQNVGIRGKGSYSMRIASYGGSRYSFKVEFDHYDRGKTYHGLDKLALNNISMDNTYMKDFLAYQIMGQNGVSSPLCSYVYLTVNGEDWGLYLAVEGIEEAFLKRNYGSDAGKLYKPDSSENFGGWGGPESGESDKDAPKEDFENTEDAGDFQEDEPKDVELSDIIKKLPEDSKLAAALKELPEGTTFWSMWEKLPEDFDFSSAMKELEDVPGLSELFGHHGGGRGGMDDEGSEDVKLKYIDDNPDSYPNIFNNAKTKVTKADKQRLIASLKRLNQGESIEETVDVEQVIRYFALHNFICNGDSYTGGMVHNYYLYEKDGKMSMIPWDYNLAFGDCFNYDATATGVVNSPVDSPVSEGSLEDRPMAAWIFQNETWLSLYHQYYKKFVSDWLENGKLDHMIASVSAQISSYVQKDPTKSCTYKEFEKGAATLREFCRLRAESVNGQLNGTIPSTKEGQKADPQALVDASGIDLSDMGGMAGGGGGWSRFEDGNGTEESKNISSKEHMEQTEGKDAEADFTDEDEKGVSHMQWRDGKLANGETVGNSALSEQKKVEAYFWIVISVLVLVGGLFTAFAFRKYGFSKKKKRTVQMCL